MAQYRITANGTVMGVYEGETSIDAREAYARAAGFRDFDQLLEITEDDASVVEIVELDRN